MKNNVTLTDLNIHRETLLVTGFNSQLMLIAACVTGLACLVRSISSARLISLSLIQRLDNLHQSWDKSTGNHSQSELDSSLIRMCLCRSVEFDNEKKAENVMSSLLYMLPVVPVTDRRQRQTQTANVL